MLLASQIVIHIGTVVYECQEWPLLLHYLQLKWLWTRGGEPKKPLATPSAVSLDLHPQREKNKVFSPGNHNPKCVYAVTKLLYINQGIYENNPRSFLAGEKDCT